MAFFDFILLIVFLVFIVSRFLSHKLPKAPKKRKPSHRKGPDLDAKVVSFEQKTQKSKLFEEKPQNLAQNLDDLDGVAKIRAVDPSFDEKEFLEGAKQAYVLYWQAVADADEDTLDNLTCPRLFDAAMANVEVLSKENKRCLTRIDGFKKVEIMATNVQGKTAFIDVHYTVSQAQAEVKKETVSTSAKAKDVRVIWSWARNLNDPDPNWELEDIKIVN